MRLRLVALETPRVLRRCPRCDSVRPFISSDNFRVNAQQHRLDVWLIYRCASCDATWNQTIVTRKTHAELGATLHEHFQRNDRATAWRYAFDLELLRRTGAAFDLEVPYRVDRSDTHERTQILLELEWPCRVRLDRLLSAELGVSRAELQRCVVSGEIDLGKSKLEKPAAHGALIRLQPTGAAAPRLAAPPRSR